MLSSVDPAYLLPVQPLATPQGPHIHSDPDRRFHVSHVVSGLFLLFFLSCLPAATNDSHQASSYGSLPSVQADSWLLWWATPLLSVTVHHRRLVLSRSGCLWAEMRFYSTPLSKSSTALKPTKSVPWTLAVPGGFQHQSCGQIPCSLTRSIFLQLRRRSRWLSFASLTQVEQGKAPRTPPCPFSASSGGSTSSSSHSVLPSPPPTDQEPRWHLASL